MLLSRLISDAAIRSNPLVTRWDDEWGQTRLELNGAPPVIGTPAAVRDAAQSLAPPDRADVAVAALDAFASREFTLPCPAGSITCARQTLIMGIINTTPDSFSDGSPAMLDKDAAVERGLALAEQGADILDVGGESTRPGADPVPEDEERRRTVPVVADLAKRCGKPISIDTMKASVAAAALDAGASVVNDVSALRDPDMAAVVQRTGAVLVLMHMKGEPRTMQTNPTYGNVLAEIALFLRHAMARAARANIPLDRIILDPGIGFGKTLAHNTEILRRLPVLASLGRPILVGCSRKSLIQNLLDLPVDRRLNASLALNVLSIAGRASIIRVHDVKEAVEAAAMADAVLWKQL